MNAQGAEGAGLAFQEFSTNRDSSSRLLHSSQFKAQEEAGGAVDVEGLTGRPRIVGGGFEMFETAEEISEGDSGFHSGEGCADAGMDAVAEGDVGIWVAGDIEAVGFGELFWIAVG